MNRGQIGLKLIELSQFQDAVLLKSCITALPAVSPVQENLAARDAPPFFWRVNAT
jgi:hypothetical protein